MNQFAHSAENISSACHKKLTSVSILDVTDHLDEVAVMGHHKLVMLHHDGKSTEGDNVESDQLSHLYGLKPLICRLMVE